MERNGSKTRGSPKREIAYHKGGVYSRRNQRDGEMYYFIRYTLPDGRRKREKVGTRKQGAKDLLQQRRTEVRLGTYVDTKEKAANSADPSRRKWKSGSLNSRFMATVYAHGVYQIGDV